MSSKLFSVAKVLNYMPRYVDALGDIILCFDFIKDKALVIMLNRVRPFGNKAFRVTNHFCSPL